MRFAVIGAGKIGSAVALALDGRVGKVIATRRNLSKISHLKDKNILVTNDNELACRESDVVIFTLKPPQVIPEMRKLREHLANKLVISLAAAISLDMLKEAAPESYLVRAMSNVAILAKAAYTVYCPHPDVPDWVPQVASEVFGLFGWSRMVEEAYLDALTALSGSGPAYLYTVMEAMVYGGLMVGLPRELSTEAVAYSMIGASKMVLESGMHLAELRDMVVTPGGVTIEGIFQLEENRLRTALMKAIVESTEKAISIAERARREANRAER